MRILAEQIYSNLLVEEARLHWNRIVEEQVDSAPWIDTFGKTHPERCTRLWDSFMDCMTFHLLMVFPTNSAEINW